MLRGRGEEKFDMERTKPPDRFSTKKTLNYFSRSNVVGFVSLFALSLPAVISEGFLAVCVCLRRVWNLSCCGGMLVIAWAWREGGQLRGLCHLSRGLWGNPDRSHMRAFACYLPLVFLVLIAVTPFPSIGVAVLSRHALFSFFLGGIHQRDNALFLSVSHRGTSRHSAFFPVSQLQSEFLSSHLVRPKWPTKTQNPENHEK